MRRIEVVATIRDGYAFAITHLGGVIGLIWVPMVLATIMGFFSLQRYYNDFIDAMASGNVAALGPSMLMMLGYLVAALLLYAVMFVAVVQLALGARGAPAVAHFAFGNLEWRMFRALVAFIGVILLLVLPAFVMADAVFVVAGTKLPQSAGPALMLMIFYGVLLLAMPRFFLLLPTVAVAETAPVLRRSWMLSAGNFLRLLAVLLAVFGPILLSFVCLEFALAGRVPAHGPAGNEQVQMLGAIMRARDVLPLVSGLGFLISPLLVGLLAGASVSVWRTLKDEPALDIAV
jgi:hypothetical protein